MKEKIITYIRENITIDKIPIYFKHLLKSITSNWLYKKYVNKDKSIDNLNKSWKFISKKLLELIWLLVVFYIFAFSYSFFTGIHYSTFSSQQIQEFINKELPDADSRIEIYKKDLIWFWDESLIVLISPTLKDINEKWFWDENTDRLYIFDKISKNPLQRFIYDWDIYKKSFSFVLPIKCNTWLLENEYWEKCLKWYMKEIKSDLESISNIEYLMEKRKTHIWNIHFLNVDTRSDILIIGYDFNWGFNPWENKFLLIKHDIKNWYSIWSIFNEYSLAKEEDFSEYSNYSTKFFHLNEKLYVNWKLKEIDIPYSFDNYLKFDHASQTLIKVNYDLSKCSYDKWETWCSFDKEVYSYDPKNREFYENLPKWWEITEWTNEFNDFFELWKQ